MPQCLLSSRIDKSTDTALGSLRPAIHAVVGRTVPNLPRAAAVLIRVLFDAFQSRTGRVCLGKADAEAARWAPSSMRNLMPPWRRYDHRADLRDRSEI